MKIEMFIESTVLILLLGASRLPLTQAVDPCDLPRYCATGTNTSNPDNCESYLQCVDGSSWIARSCPDTTCFDLNELECVVAPCDCFPACPVYTGPTTEGFTREILTPGLCFDVETCEEGEKFADMSDCEFYFQCIGGIPIRMPCSTGFVFDVFDLDCVQPSNEFNCDYRCITTGPTVPTDAVTTSVWETTGYNTQERTTTAPPSPESTYKATEESSTAADTQTTDFSIQESTSTTNSPPSLSTNSSLPQPHTTTRDDVTDSPDNDDSLVLILVSTVSGVVVFIIIIIIVVACVCSRNSDNIDENVQLTRVKRQSGHTDADSLSSI
ncbi:hypothetical protein CAPTEDRAFT_206771 [Capitella teleta]|uniref:Chitin-binding type-2 domain-containing protein n=1 Tax=Capitella teleta TaxID=283909 RepID=R7UCD5_CAPTE|nr:hypothetical protein CAPTEDRAFT_206771 [Capitella teleta]|eukprot:ELU01423.1 hypothetical protein CAPTEDRAFT_206771 [Capitella teleta]